MSAVKRAFMVAIIAMAVLSVAGCLGQSDRDKVQERYDQKVIATNALITEVENVSDQQNQYAMTEPMMKAWLIDYRSQVVTLGDTVNDTISEGNVLLGYLSPGSDEYSTVKANEQNLLLNLNLYWRDYNHNAGEYNGVWGVQNGTVPLL